MGNRKESGKEIAMDAVNKQHLEAQLLIDGEWTDGRGNIAAIAAVSHIRARHRNLGEGVVDVSVRAFGGRHDRDL